jgi:hypothetical protein
MNLIRHLFLLVLCVAATLPSHGQEMTLFDTGEQFNCEDLLARLDRFSLQIAHNPTASIGEIILYPGPDPIESAKHAKYLQRYLDQRDLNDLITITVTAPRERFRIEFWTGLSAAKRTLENVPITLKLPKVTRPIVFDTDLFEMYVEKGKRQFVGYDCAACCISNLDWNLLSQILVANPNLKTYLVIRGKPTRHRLLTAEIKGEMRDANFDGKRVKFLYANKNIEGSSALSEFAVYLTQEPVRSARELRWDRE